MGLGSRTVRPTRTQRTRTPLRAIGFTQLRNERAHRPQTFRLGRLLRRPALVLVHADGLRAGLCAFAVPRWLARRRSVVLLHVDSLLRHRFTSFIDYAESPVRAIGKRIRDAVGAYLPFLVRTVCVIVVFGWRRTVLGFTNRPVMLDRPTVFFPIAFPPFIVRRRDSVAYCQGAAA